MFCYLHSYKNKGKRNILMGKHILITTTNKPWKELMDEICQIYDFGKLETINLLSMLEAGF